MEFENNKLTLVQVTAGACSSVLSLSHASHARLTHQLQLASIAAEHGEPALRSGHLEAIEKILQVENLVAHLCVNTPDCCCIARLVT